MTSENKQLVEITRVLIKMLDKNDKEVINIIQERILVEKEKLGKYQKGFFESLISNLEKEVREMNSVLLIFVVNKLF